jgi:hypothetical protein
MNYPITAKLSRPAGNYHRVGPLRTGRAHLLVYTTGTFAYFNRHGAEVPTVRPSRIDELFDRCGPHTVCQSIGPPPW